VATVDAKHQVVVEAQEHDLLMAMIEGTRENFARLEDIFEDTALHGRDGVAHRGEHGSAP
jgi:6-phosphogluconate dehydrogenase (decarboxylating)